MNYINKNINVKRIVILFGILFSFEVTYSQYFFAGYYSPLIIYVDIDPDTIINSTQNGGYHSSTIELDIDNNDTIDFKLKTSGGGGAGGGGSYCEIIPMTSNCRILSDTLTENGYTVYVPDTLNFGDTINSVSDWNSNTCYIWSRPYGLNTFPKVYSWLNVGDHYIGVSVTNNSDTLYGWIRVNTQIDSIWPSRTFLTVKDYACNKNVVSVFNIEITATPIIFPNPINNSLTIVLSEDFINGSISIFNINGQLIISTKITNQSSTLNTSKFKSGIYLIKVENNETSIYRKIIKN